MVRSRSKSRALGGTRRWLGVSLALALFGVFSASANAGQITIGHFSPVSGGVTWTNTSPTGMLLTGAVRVNFTNDLTNTVFNNAILTISASSSTPAVNANDQPINVATSTVTVKDSTNTTTLMSTTFTGDLLAPQNNNGIAQLLGGTVNYLAGSPTTGVGTFSIFLPNVSPNIILTQGVFSNFSADVGVGQFLLTVVNQAQPVPEPASVAMFGTGIAAVGFLAHRRRRLVRLAVS
jgi:hypothetical protein